MRSRSNYKVNGSAVQEVLADDQCKQVLSGAMKILKETGVAYQDEEAVEILKEAGCYVENGRVYIPVKLVEKALRTVPSQVTLYNSRTKEAELYLEGGNAYFGTGSEAPCFLDPYEEAIVDTTQETVEMATKLADALPRIDFVMSMGNIQDKSESVRDRYQFLAQLANTSKPIVTTAVDKQGCADIVEMSETVAGGAEELKRRPFMALCVKPDSPLKPAAVDTEKLMYASEKSLPVTYTPYLSAGANVPATLAGAVAVGLAEVLAALVLNQQIEEGAPFIMGGYFTIVDTENEICSDGAPESSLMQAALSDIAHYLDIPMFGACGGTDSKTVDEQAAIEDALSILTSAKSGANLNHGIGSIEYGNATALENLIICDEMIGFARRSIKGIEVNDETLALDIIHEVGPGGHFITQQHTMDNFQKETWYPDLFQRKNYVDWEDEGKKTLTDRAHEKALDILESHEPDGLDDEMIEKLEAIVEE
ncbi:trimethylamine methyltransferase family protein [Acetohalobium arabaticum]|uniref:Trimethylamine methyltransferase n=1 Tax=Acetohalobium arabaticum (strain ATCC 49924 / DSM 5501 / Z-7288) TaxID=574087 RepID=D9QPY9_ACEAZ|nr:trimethylamine methyltransferase family protein [Acetohalobium arabaticum]ADL12580.1 trimethylamine methyltransferase [Acetohalobium arabaticum DSM 5501]